MFFPRCIEHWSKERKGRFVFRPRFEFSVLLVPHKSFLILISKPRSDSDQVTRHLLIAQQMARDELSR